MSEILPLSHQCNISWFMCYHQLWFLNFTLYSTSAAPVPLPCVPSTQPSRNSAAEIRNIPRHLPKVPLPYRIVAPAQVLCFSLHSEAWRYEDGRATALWKPRELPPPTEGHGRTGPEDLQNSILGRKGPFPFSAGYFGYFPTPKPEVPLCIWHLFTGYPSLPSLPSHTQTRLFKITNESIHFYLDTWP